MRGERTLNRTLSTHGTRRALLLLAMGVGLVAGPGVIRADDLKDGRAALQAGRYDEALKSFEKASSQGLAAGRAGVGQVWLRRRQYDKALEAFKTAQKMDPTLALAFWGEGEVYHRQDKCAEAIPMFEKAVSLDRKFPEAQLGLGDCYVKTKQFAKATTALNEGLKWGPKWRPRFLVALGGAAVARDSLRAAGVYFTRAREEAPTDPEVRRALGEFYIQRGTWSLAVLETQAAVDLDSSDVELRYSLAQALEYDQRYDQALDQYRWIARRDADFAPAQLSLGSLLYRAGAHDPSRYPEARIPLERYTQLAPQDPKGWSLLGRTLANLKMRDEAITAMLKAEQLGDKNKELYSMLFRVMAEKRDWTRAVQYYELSEKLPKDELLVAQMYAIQGNVPRADSIYANILSHDSTSSAAKVAMNERGKLRFRQKDFEGALAQFQKRNALDPPSSEAYFYTGLSNNQLKRYPEAVEALKKSTALDTTKADRYFWLGVVLDQQKNITDAQVAFQRSVALDDTSKSASKARAQLGYYRLLEKDWPGAIQHLERSVALDAQYVQAWVWLGQGHQNSGNREKAMEAYRKALAIDPNQPEATKGVKVLSGAVGASSKGG
ncbi:MAG TPA: tetratricopeptide repeat protein [Candidatus Eisenbacteria bacterium]|nr:tetratricopeptide repeat protein [Candidatus Eisenbacteria bacterium]